MVRSANYKVQLRGGFSDRNGINMISTEMQLYDFDERTRKCLINCIYDIFKKIDENSNCYINDEEENWKKFYLNILTNVYLYTYNQLEFDYESDLKEFFDKVLYNTIINGKYDEILTLVEYMLNTSAKLFGHRRELFEENHNSKIPKFYYYDERKDMNRIFEKEYVGYRFIGDKIVAITDKEEVKEIEETLFSKFDGCKAHINKAIGFLSDREKPDYKNSIKESISAVESICKIIVGKGNATLGDALKILESKNGLKGQLKSGFEKLYNYTNDKGGIRHAEGLFESNVSFEEAKFMLVSCCAFVNYLIAEYGKTI